MADVKTYSPTDVTVSFNGVILDGFSDGTFIKASPSSESFTRKVGADGEVSRVRTNDNTYKVEITLNQTSAANVKLSALHEADKLTGKGVGPLLITDINGETVLFFPQAWIVKGPEVEYKKDLSERVWEFETGQPGTTVVG